MEDHVACRSPLGGRPGILILGPPLSGWNLCMQPSYADMGSHSTSDLNICRVFLYTSSTYAEDLGIRAFRIQTFLGGEPRRMFRCSPTV